MTFRLERQGDIATLVLANPSRGNALSPALVAALDGGLDQAVADGARLVVLRGEGRHFCTGFDLSDLTELTDGDLLLRVVHIELLLQKLAGMPVSTLAVGSGRTFGAGADLFAACDHRVALEGASFSFPGPAFGLALGTARLAERVGATQARALLLAGREMRAAEALSLGLATQVVADPAEIDQMVKQFYGEEGSETVDDLISQIEGMTNLTEVASPEGLSVQSIEAMANDAEEASIGSIVEIFPAPVGPRPADRNIAQLAGASGSC